jgi:hypothetical protein
MLRRRLVEGGIGEEPEADDPGRPAVIGADRDGLAAGVELDSGEARFVGERVGRAGRVADVEPQAVASRVGSPRGPEAGLVDDSQILPAVGPAAAGARRGSDDLEEVEGTEGRLDHAVPETIVAAGPDQPHDPPGPFGRGQLDAAVHLAEIIVGGARRARVDQLGVVDSGLGRFILDGLVTVAVAAARQSERNRRQRSPTKRGFPVCHGALPQMQVSWRGTPLIA